jgi:soluble lytic murein transglycosylase-like protein
MSVTISLKQPDSPRDGSAFGIIQLCLALAALLTIFGLADVFSAHTPERQVQPQEAAAAAREVDRLAALSEQPESPEPSPAAPLAAAAAPAAGAPAPSAAVLSPRMQGALDYVKRRYKVAPDALVPVFEIAQLIGKEMRIDPLLIVAMIGIESGFNPFAESTFGARGLMQVIPRFHRDKVPQGAGDSSLLDPLVNIRVGVLVLEEAIRRSGGSLIAGLQQYAGASDAQGSYANKVLAEKERLEQAARRNAAANTDA